jgi:hypothetical protein
MSYAINALYFLPISAIGFALFYLVWWIGLRAFRVRSRWARFASVPVFAAVVFGFWLSGTRPSAVYAEAFGFPVSQDVQDLKSDRFFMGQSGGAYLRFRADRGTVERIIARGLLPMNTNHLFLLQQDVRGTQPQWWRVQDLGAGSQFYHSSATNKNTYDVIFEYLAYDPSAGLVLFKRNDVD